MGTLGKRWNLAKKRKGAVPSEETREKMSKSQKSRRKRERDEKKR